MSGHLDRALDALDAGLELATAPTTEPSYEPFGTDALAVCWRCVARAADGPLGLCAPCRALLRDDAYAAPSPMLDALGPYHWTIGENGEILGSDEWWSAQPNRIAVGFDVDPDGRGTSVAVEQIDGGAYRIIEVNVLDLRDQILTWAADAAANVAEAATTFTRRLTASTGEAAERIHRMIDAWRTAARPTPPIPAKPAHRRRYQRRH